MEGMLRMRMHRTDSGGVSIASSIHVSSSHQTLLLAHSLQGSLALTQWEFFGLQFKNRLHSSQAMGDMPMGAPG